MAFRGGKRKDVKKQSYYVWFLGAKESKGLRGEEFIRPVLHYLQDKEKELEPMKVTLQVSNKGMKIIQNVPRKNNKGKTEQIKHFIPHHAVTCVLQESKPDDDIVCCILLIYNPLTKCPVHVHAYRCDSVETATTLRTQLQILIDRPENQKKFREIENRLDAKGLLPSRRLNSDGRSTRTDDSDRTEDSFGSDRDAPATPRRENIASLYDSLAAELRERLTNKNSCPILLPPKDYDTVSRRRGKLDGIEIRRSTNLKVVGLTPVPKVPSGKLDKARESGSSGKSSGIGSDEALSSAIQEVTSHPDFESKEIDPETSSDEEDWPASEPLPIDDEVVQSEWRKAPPVGSPVRYGGGAGSSSPTTYNHHSHAPPPIHPPAVGYHNREEYVPNRYTRNGGSPPSPPVQDFRHLSLRKTSADRDPEPRSFDYRHGATEPRVPVSSGKAYREENGQFERERERDPEVIYRRRSNPLEKKNSRDNRPVSYPGNFSREAEPAPTQPASPPTFQFGYPPKERSYDPRAEPRSFNNGYGPRQTTPTSRTPDRPRPESGHHPYESLPYNSYDRYGEPKSGFENGHHGERHPSRRAEPVKERPYYVEEKRKSAYFDLPVDSRDYRHSFAEPYHRRLQLGAQY